MKALVLGGAGFIGFHLARLLADRGRDVVVVDDLSRGAFDPEIEELVGRPNVAFVRADLADPAACADLPTAGAEAHLLAARVGVAATEAAPADVLATNARIALAVLDRCAEAPPRRLVLASTSEVYAGAVEDGRRIPTAEDVPVSIADVRLPRFAYAASKVLAEAAAFAYARGRFEATVVRYHNVYGPRMGARHAVPELLLRAIRRADPFVVYGADQSRAFCYVDDAVRATADLAACPAAAGAIVHVGRPEETRVRDLARMVLDVAGHAPARIEERPAPAGSPARRAPDVSLARRLVGYAPEVGLEEGLHRTHAWYAAHA